MTDNELDVTVAALLSTTVNEFEPVTDCTVVPAGIPDVAETIIPSVGVPEPELGVNVSKVDSEVVATV